MTLRTLAALTAVFVLAACGGGGGGAGSNNGPPGSPRGPTFAEVQAANPLASLAASGEAAGNLPSFGSVTQSSSAGSVSGVTGDAVTTSFDGRNIRLTVRHTDGDRIVFNAVTDRIDSENLDPVISGYTYRGDGLLTYTDTSVSIAAIYTNWNNSDPTDYLAGGYWMHLEGRTNPLEVTGAEIGAFVDGPEISRAPTALPRLGTATYRGQATGLYVYEWSEGSEIGDLQAASTLTANFTTNTISGCIGCNGGIVVNGVAEDANGRATVFEDVHVPARMQLGAASFGSDGAFRNRDVVLERIRARLNRRGIPNQQIL